MNSCSNKVMIRRSLDLTISMPEKNYIHTKRDPPLCLCTHMVPITVCCLTVWIFLVLSEGQCKDIDLDAYSHLVLSETL